jgi:hypothetical protein
MRNAIVSLPEHRTDSGKRRVLQRYLADARSRRVV